MGKVILKFGGIDIEKTKFTPRKFLSFRRCIY